MSQSHLTEKQKMLSGELYHAFDSVLLRDRQRCKAATSRYNNAGDISRRQQVQLWRDITEDTTPLPPVAPDADQDAALFDNDPWIEAPVRLDYGTNVRLGSNVYINFNCTILDICLITIGSRTLVGPNVSFFTGTHPLDPDIRNGTAGPELAKEIHVGEDCFIGGNAVIMAGVRIGKGAVIGAGSVVIKEVPPFHVAAGNPARVIRKIETNMDPEQNFENGSKDIQGEEVPMTELADKLERVLA